MALMNKSLHTWDGNKSWMVWTPLTSYRQTMWANNPQTLMPTDPNQRATTVKNQDITKISVACWNNSENKLEIIKMIPETKTMPPIPLIRTVMSTTITTTKTVTKLKESQKLSTHPVRHVEKQTTPKRKTTLEPMQPIDRLPGIQDRKDKITYQREPIKVTLMKLLKLQPTI